MVEKFKQNELISALTHLVGALLSVVALVALILLAVNEGTVTHIVGFSIFGASMVLLYLASTLYHLMPLASKAKSIFRRVDHAMIFVLIAGTYTPVCLVPLWGAWGWTMLAVVWTLALAGVLMKGFWLKIPGWLSGVIYLGMGWISVIAFPAMLENIPELGMVWLVAGGILYTVGLIFYALDKVLPQIKWFGLHEIFHVFVLAGSFSHFWLMWEYVAYIP